MWTVTVTEGAVETFREICSGEFDALFVFNRQHRLQAAEDIVPRYRRRVFMDGRFFCIWSRVSGETVQVEARRE